jgi:hypothetical protein
MSAQADGEGDANREVPRRNQYERRDDAQGRV